MLLEANGTANNKTTQQCRNIGAVRTRTERERGAGGGGEHNVYDGTVVTIPFLLAT